MKRTHDSNLHEEEADFAEDEFRDEEVRLKYEEWVHHLPQQLPNGMCKRKEISK